MVLKLIPILVSIISLNAQAFVLLSGPTEAKLDADELAPTILFQVSTDIPSISGKESFHDGIYSNLDDQDFFETLIQLSIAPWNNVSTSYIQLSYEFSDSAVIDSQDRIHSIGVASLNRVSAATAATRYEDGLIYDCDISLSSNTQSATSLAYTLMHEFGHCLGLGHNHSDKGAAMGYARTDLNLSLGADDIFGVTYLYPTSEVGNAKELIACGTIGQNSKPYPISIIVLILCPLGLGLLKSGKTA